MYGLALLLLLATACIHSMKSEMEAWIGHDQSEIVQKWGAPIRSADLSDGTRVLTWETRYNAADQDEPPEMVSCVQSFTFSKAGKAIAWSTRNCPKHFVRR